MTEGNMTGRPHGGVNEPQDDVLPGERPEKDLVGPPSQQEGPRAARDGEMSTSPGETGSGVPDTDNPLGGRTSS
ncbi:hypothetical protein ACU610_12375 [Geodermatophilus sp. URMC 61]|uniref:hypothetical protein n=1 Tax=Geodermatophilus sp. URMC 61 TaxID=3423411 RepID=UPI00406C6019